MKSEILKIEKPWGYELIFAKTLQYVGKILHIEKGHQLSLQFHRHKEETIFVASGRILFVYEKEAGKLVEYELSAGEAHHIPPGRLHRMIALENTDIFEVSTPQLDDVVRIEDSYGRSASQ